MPVHLYGASELVTKAEDFSGAFLYEPEHDAIKFRGVSIDHLVFVENAKKHNILINDIDFVDGDFSGGLARRSVEMYEKNINLLRYNHKRKAGSFNLHLKFCKDRAQHI